MDGQRGASVKEYVYFIQSQGNGNIKIGRTRNIQGRFNTLNVASPDPLELLGVIPTDDSVGLELKIHKMFSHAHVHSEWFYPAMELLDFIKSEAVVVDDE
jgi:hypothetical protein